VATPNDAKFGERLCCKVASSPSRETYGGISKPKAALKHTFRKRAQLQSSSSMQRHVFGVVVCMALSAIPCAAFAPALPLVRSPGMRLSTARPVLRQQQAAVPRMALMGFDMGTALALAQAVNDVIAVPGVVSSYYMGALDANAMAVDSATAAFLYALGVITSSAISGKWEKNMVKHVSKWSALGVVDGVCTHSWYEVLQRAADSVALDKVPEAASMMLATSVLYTPLYCAGFLGLLSLLDGRGWRGAQERLRLDWSALLRKTLKVWMPVNVLLFGLVPLQARTIVSMGVHFLFLVVIALWDAAIRESRAQGTAAGPVLPDMGSANDVLNLKLATAFVPVDGQRELGLSAVSNNVESLPVREP